MMPLPLSVNFASSPFEWDAMAKAQGVELWSIRAPVDVRLHPLLEGSHKARADASQLKSSRLTALNIAMGSSGPSGSLTVKSSSYSLHSAGFPTPATADVDEEGRQPTAGPGLADAMMMEDGGERLRFEGGAEMMGGMTLMVPRV